MQTAVSVNTYALTLFNALAAQTQRQNSVTTRARRSLSSRIFNGEFDLAIHPMPPRRSAFYYL